MNMPTPNEITATVWIALGFAILATLFAARIGARKLLAALENHVSKTELASAIDGLKAKIDEHSKTTVSTLELTNLRLELENARMKESQEIRHSLRNEMQVMFSKIELSGREIHTTLENLKTAIEVIKARMERDPSERTRSTDRL